MALVLACVLAMGGAGVALVLAPGLLRGMALGLTLAVAL